MVLRFHLTLVIMAKVLRKEMANVGLDVEKKQNFFSTGGSENWCNYYESQQGVSQKPRNIWTV